MTKGQSAAAAKSAEAIKQIDGIIPVGPIQFTATRFELPIGRVAVRSVGKPYRRSDGWDVDMEAR
jgi:hypothetical protein